MCGIVGRLAFESRPAHADAIEQMLAAVAHRGPDGHGSFADDRIQLGHHRLSILDPTPAGAQPMRRHNTVIVHNGEIYNYLELAEELRGRGYVFSTDTDTEVILAAYDAWGLDAIGRFNGMWAFALWDIRKQRLLLSRDRLGVKPLYYHATPRSLSFASEVPALVAPSASDGDGWVPQPELTAVRDFLVRGLLDHSELTFVKGILALPAGHSMLVGADGDARLNRYWGPPTLSDDARARVRGSDAARDRARVDEFRALFEDSVRLRLRSDVAVGTCLSGGLDSSAVVATATAILNAPRRPGSADASGHERAPRLAFHVRFPEQGVDESRYADLVARQSGLELVYRSPTMSAVVETILPVLRAQGEPFAGSSVFAQFALMQAAHSRDVKVLLDGQGGDEVLAGYLPFLGYRSAGLIRAGHVLDVPRELRAQVRFGSVGPAAALRAAIRALMPNAAVERVRSIGGRYGLRVSGELARVETAARRHREPGTVLARRLWQDVAHDTLPALLRYEDRNSMAFGIEARVPFLDYRLVEYALALPDRLKISNGMTKAILRRAMTDRLPTEVLARRDKVGFATPQRGWLRDARTEIEQMLLDEGQLIGRGWLRRSEVERVTSGLFGVGTTHEQLWRALIVEAWLRTVWPVGPQSPALGSGLTANLRPV